MILILTAQEKETLLYALLVGVTCAANDAENLRKDPKQAAQADEIEKLAVRCRHLFEKAKNAE